MNFDSVIDYAWEYEMDKWYRYYKLCEGEPDNRYFAESRDEHDKHLTQLSTFKMMMSEEDKETINAILAKYKID